MEELTMWWIITFAIMFVVFGGFIGMLVDANMTGSIWKKIICTILLTTASAGLFVGGIAVEEDADSDKWNNGVCLCGGTYKFANASRHKQTVHYYYVCDACDHVIDTHKAMK
jgi:hypothetical protein